MSDGKGTQTICPTCGATFQRRVKGQTYCSRKCSAKARYAHRHETEKAYGVCRVCGKSLKGCKGRRNYCSDACSVIGLEALRRERMAYKKHRHICPQCGKEFWSRELNRKYCSVECKQKGMQATMKDQIERKASGVDHRGQRVLLTVIRPVPVQKEFAPRLGELYAAVLYKGMGSDVIVVPGFGKYGLILRPDEVKILKG